MTTKHRRQFITAGLAALGAGLVPSFDTEVPAWLRQLNEQLASVTEWLRVEAMNDDSMRLNCGVRDVFALAARAGELAGPKSRVLARGNELRFKLEGLQVSLILHPIS